MEEWCLTDNFLPINYIQYPDSFNNMVRYRHYKKESSVLTGQAGNCSCLVLIGTVKIQLAVVRYRGPFLFLGYGRNSPVDCALSKQSRRIKCVIKNVVRYTTVLQMQVINSFHIWPQLLMSKHAASYSFLSSFLSYLFFSFALAAPEKFVIVFYCLFVLVVSVPIKISSLLCLCKLCNLNIAGFV